MQKDGDILYKKSRTGVRGVDYFSDGFSLDFSGVSCEARACAGVGVFLITHSRAVSGANEIMRPQNIPSPVACANE